MIFSCESSDLLRAATLAKKHSDDVAVFAPGDALTITTRKGSLVLRQTLTCAARGEPLTIAADDFARAAKALVGTVAAKMNAEGTRWMLAAGKRRAETGAMAPREIPPVIPSGGEPRTLDAMALRAAIERVVVACSGDVTRPHLCGVQLEFYGDRLQSVATNGHWLMVYGEHAAEPTATLLLPAPLVAVLLDMLPLEGGVVLTAGPSTITVEGAGWAVSHGATEATFPSWRMIVPAGRSLTIHADRDALAAEVSAVAQTTKVLKGSSGVAFTVDGDLAALRSDDGDREGDSSIEVKTQPSGAKGAFGINSGYLLDALRSMPAGDVAFSMSGGELDPLVLEPSDSSGVAVLMPVRV